jgi:hypothetical protein
MLKDEEKRATCERQGITLIEIPHWWDRSREGLLAAIKKARPDAVVDPSSGTISFGPANPGFSQRTPVPT